MGQFQLSKSDMTALKEGRFDQLHAAIKRSVEKHDFDSKWVATPADKIFRHDLTAIPSVVHVQTSDNADGSNFQSDGYSAVTGKSITVAGTKAYTRVLINR